jgi:hypothetical protein
MSLDVALNFSRDQIVVDDKMKKSWCLWHDIEVNAKIARLGFDVERSNSCDVEAHWTRLA